MKEYLRDYKNTNLRFYSYFLPGSFFNKADVFIFKNAKKFKQRNLRFTNNF